MKFQNEKIQNEVEEIFDDKLIKNFLNLVIDIKLDYINLENINQDEKIKLFSYVIFKVLIIKIKYKERF